MKDMKNEANKEDEEDGNKENGRDEIKRKKK